MKLGFYITDNKVFDNSGNEIIENEKGIVIVSIDSIERRFVKCKLINWLTLNPEIKQAKIPKPKPILSQFDAVQKEIKLKKVKVLKVKTVKIKKVRYVKKEKVLKEKPIREKKVRIPIIRKPKIKTGYINRRGGEFGYEKKSIYCITLNKIFDSSYQASKELGLNRSAICHVLKGVYNQTKGYKFEYN